MAHLKIVYRLAGLATLWILAAGPVALQICATIECSDRAKYSKIIYIDFDCYFEQVHHAKAF